MDKFLKFLAKLDPRTRTRVSTAAKQIVAGDWQGLDIVTLRGYKNLFRCRIGDIRLIFVKHPNGYYEMLDAGFRGEIYKRWK